MAVALKSRSKSKLRKTLTQEERIRRFQSLARSVFAAQINRTTAGTPKIAAEIHSQEL